MNIAERLRGKRRWVLLGAVALLLVTAMMAGSFRIRNIRVPPLTAEQIAAIPPIEFEQMGSEGITPATAFVCHIPLMNARVHQRTAVAYVRPQKRTREKLIAQLGLEDSASRPFGDDLVAYGTLKEGYSLRIDPYGAFTCSLNNPQPMAEMTLSDKECRDIANAFMESSGLFCEHFAGRAEVMENGFVTNNFVAEGRANTPTKKTVIYPIRFPDGDGAGGNASVSVDVDSHGEVVLVVYNHQHYENVGKVPLITVEEAYARVVGGEESVFYSGVSSAEKLVFKTVELAYWEKSLDGDRDSRLPVYCFTGESYAGSCHEPFEIMVSAIDRG